MEEGFFFLLVAMEHFLESDYLPLYLVQWDNEKTRKQFSSLPLGTRNEKVLLHTRVSGEV